MTLDNILMILAILLAPLVALQVQKRLDDRRALNARRRRIFETLMGTRSARTSADHVHALNMIDLAFCSRTLRGQIVRKGHDKTIYGAWKQYRDHLGQRNGDSEDAIRSWAASGDKLFAELLQKMSRSMGYDFDSVDISRTSYSPTAHGELEQDNHALRKGLIRLLNGDSPIQVVVHATEDGAIDPKKQSSIQDALLDVLDGNRPLHVLTTSNDDTAKKGGSRPKATS